MTTASNHDQANSREMILAKVESLSPSSAIVSANGARWTLAPHAAQSCWASLRLGALVSLIVGSDGEPLDARLMV